VRFFGFTDNDRCGGRYFKIVYRMVQDDLRVKTVEVSNRITIRDDFPAAPICPHCGKEIQEIAARRVESMLGVRFIYYCTACRKVLGVSHRKGFWMG
jgi:uncharacterized protein with PIN domain